MSNDSNVTGPGISAFDLTGRRALITGSSRGIGFALAQALGHAGANVVLNGRDIASINRAVDNLRALDIDASGAAFSVCDEAEVVAAIDEIERERGPIDILVNNAGIQIRGPFLEFPLASFRELVDTNLVSAFIVGQAVGRKMAERGRGKIINICSVQSDLARPNIAPYTATKGGLKMLTKGMCADLGPKGIQVNGLAPGYFDTELTSALVGDPVFSEWIAKRTPLGRWGKVEELGGTAVFLASSAADFITGQTIFVDGGMTAVL